MLFGMLVTLLLTYMMCFLKVTIIMDMREVLMTDALLDYGKPGPNPRHDQGKGRSSNGGGGGGGGGNIP